MSDCESCVFQPLPPPWWVRQQQGGLVQTAAVPGIPWTMCCSPQALWPSQTPHTSWTLPQPSQTLINLSQAREFCRCPARWSSWHKVPDMPRCNVQSSDWNKAEIRMEQQVWMFGAAEAMPFPKQNVLCPFFSFLYIPNITCAWVL